jgi:biopolymer transport protein ExbB
MADLKRSIWLSLHGAFHSWLGVAVLFNLVVFGPIAGHAQPALEPSAALSTTAPAPEPPRPMDPVHSNAVPSLAPSQSTETASAELSRDLTPLGMFASADVIVKSVMLGLVFASALTWTIWLAKTLELVAARRRLRRAHSKLMAAASFDEVASSARAESRHVALLIDGVEGELQRSPDPRDVEGIKERIARRFGRIDANVGRQMMRATGIIATIGATAPFVGLFGTVWGIMNSFIGISKLHTTNLAVVAPGIAEALLATACGLAAAIPAVVIYNGFARSMAQYRGLFADVSVEVFALVGRDLTWAVSAAEEKRVFAAVAGGAVR